MCKGSYADRDAKCPYYKARDGTSVRCEGYTEGMSIQVRFGSGEQLKAWARRHCDNLCGWRECHLQEGREEDIDRDDLAQWEGIVGRLRRK